MRSCCPSGSYCAWSNSQVACCQNDCTCSSGGGDYEPSSYYATTTYYQPTSTYCEECEEQTTTIYQQPTSTYCDECEQPQATTVVVAPAGAYSTTQAYPGAYSEYCSTQYAQGPGLPTTAQGQCGTILIEEPSEAMRRVVGTIKLIAMVGVLQLLGGLLLVWR